LTRDPCSISLRFVASRNDTPRFPADRTFNFPPAETSVPYSKANSILGSLERNELITFDGD
ncbi:MAG: hypothetical protein WA861_09690, partial [Candidatus Binatus sp.]